MTTLTVARAAILGKDGQVYSVEPPGRHCDVIRSMFAQGSPCSGDAPQGFLLSDGTFVDRQRAKEVAREAGQLLPQASRLPQLYSEDLW